MATVAIAATTQPQTVPIGPVPGSYRVGILDVDGAEIASQVVATPAAEFPGIPTGIYVAFAELLDADGAPFPGVDRITEAFEVGPETITIEAPLGLTVSVTLGAAMPSGIGVK